MEIKPKIRSALYLIFASVPLIIFNPLKSLVNLSPEYFTLNGMYPWAVLFLCIFFLFAKRREIQSTITAPKFVLGGVIITTASFFMPARVPEFEIFRLLLALVGLAFIFFGEAASLPAILLCIYGFGISFPLLVNAYAGAQYAQLTAWVTYNIVNHIIPVTASGNAISMTTIAGNELVVLINAACSGAASMSVFLAIFALMSLDVPMKKKKWIAMLLFGVIGTSIQNILRLVVLLIVGYYYGPGAVQGGESVAGYIIFPMWYAFFAFVYLKYAKKESYN